MSHEPSDNLRYVTWEEYFTLAKIRRLAVNVLKEGPVNYFITRCADKIFGEEGVTDMGIPPPPPFTEFFQEFLPKNALKLCFLSKKHLFFGPKS